MTADRIYLFVHILGAFMIMGGATVGAFLNAAARRTSRTEQLELLLRIGNRIPMVTAPGALLAIVFGSLLVMPRGHNFGEAWISASYLAWIVAMGLSAAVLGPAERAAHGLALKELEAGRTESEALAAAVNAPRIRITSHILEALVLVFLYLMVFRPGA